MDHRRPANFTDRFRVPGGRPNVDGPDTGQAPLRVGFAGPERGESSSTAAPPFGPVDHVDCISDDDNGTRGLIRRRVQRCDDLPGHELGKIPTSPNPDSTKPRQLRSTGKVKRQHNSSRIAANNQRIGSDDFPKIRLILLVASLIEMRGMGGRRWPMEQSVGTRKLLAQMELAGRSTSDAAVALSPSLRQFADATRDKDGRFRGQAEGRRRVRCAARTPPPRAPPSRTP
ncbi:hypothetical protein NL676_018478 [Syzygium grande]|nr:hypothetical protein NL676_018478 [Syzygium grande]